LSQKKYQTKLYCFQAPVFHDQTLGNFEQATSTNKPGPGEKGEPHHVPSDRENEALQSLSEYGMNMACSDDISLNRTIPDHRMDE
jgi:polypeptide N-acetylgalactosaminyltransferase